MEDCRILDLYWARAEDAIVQTQRKYGSYLHAIAFQILADREDAGESVNDTYLAAWDSIPPNRPNVLSAYLGKLTRHISIDRLRHRVAKKRCAGQYDLSLEELSPYLSAGDTTAQQVEQSILAQTIAAYLDTLPTTHRQVFLCRYFYFDSINQIARRFFLTESYTKVLLHRVRKGLQLHLEKEGLL